jgi:L-malate glycosyltransferase
MTILTAGPGLSNGTATSDRSTGGTAAPALHLLHVFPTFAVGGVQNRIIRVMNALGGKYRHTVMALDGDFDAAPGVAGTIDCAFESLPAAKSAFLSITNLRRARAALRRLRPDLMLTYNWGAIEWTLANRAPIQCRHVHLESGFGPDESPQRQNWRRVLARRVLLGRSERIVVPSRVLYDLVCNLWRLPRGRVLYLPNGVDCNRYAVAEDESFAAALGIPKGCPVIGTVTALRPEKNLLRLVRVFAAVPRDLAARLVIVGDGPERAALAQAAAAANVADRVIFTGAVADPARVLGRFAVFAITSDTEQMPNAVLEAMAAGLAVAATDVGDVKRMVAPENADFVVPLDDEAALTGALARLLRDRALSMRIGRANQLRVRADYSLDAMVARYDALFAGTL